MSKRLDGKVCLITGGARGQGAAEAALFRAEGARVYITDVLVEAGEKTAAECGATFFEHDVSSESAWRDIVDRVLAESGQLDVLVNNAGIFQKIPLVETSLDTWNRYVSVNQTGTFLGLATVVPHMIDRRSGSIVNISSVAGLRGSRAFAYAATKWAVRGMTRSAAIELGPYGVRVNAICPGVIDTPMVTREAVQKSYDTVPLGRPADADEIAKLALWLASDDSAYATGAEFVLDGGFTA